jgi:hypothetical protein
MAADAEVFAASQIFRLQAPHLTARVGDTPIDVVTARRALDPAPGEHRVTAVDAGDGSDLSGTRGRLAVVKLPASRGDGDAGGQRAAISRRAAEAGAAMLAFVDEARPYLTLANPFPDRWAEIPVLAAAGLSAASLTAAAAAQAEVTITVAASPVVYDIASPYINQVDPAPVIDQAEQARLVRLNEHFHRDANGTGPTGDLRIPISVWPTLLESRGPLLEHRTAYVSSDVVWQSGVSGPAVADWGQGPELDRSAWLSLDAGAHYGAGSQQTLTWLRRPQRPAALDGRDSGVTCTSPIVRTVDRLKGVLSTAQDGSNRTGCVPPLEGRHTLSRDGTVLGTGEGRAVDFPMPADGGSYTLTYEQTAQAPYLQRSSTSWTFRSAAPRDPAVIAMLIPLLVIDYRLPLDTQNRLTGDVATVGVSQVAGVEQQRVRRFRVWTSIDDGANWTPTQVRRLSEGTYEVHLPSVAAGTGVSLRVDASDAGGSRIDQTLLDAYTA